MKQHCFSGMITAHAGCENTTPNSAENVRAALDTGCEALELDVRIADDTVYFSHDALYGAALAHAYTLDELLRDIAGTDIKINCDIKQWEAFSPIFLQFQKQRLLSRMILTGLFPADFCDPDRKVAVYLNLNNYIQQDDIVQHPQAAAEKALALAKDYGTRVNLVGFNLPYSWASKYLTDTLHAHGLEVSVWTPSDTASLSAMMALGVDNITTRTPLLALRLRQNFRR